MRNWGVWLVLGLYYSVAFSLPTEPEVVFGEASLISENPSSLSITTSDKAILNFVSFGIGEGERVRFIQPNCDSCALSRVVGSEGSEIFGRLEANGRLFLVNPQGIYFGPNASVNVGSLVASTLNIRDEDFIGENYRFFSAGGEGALVNEGRLGAEGFIALLGPVVQNRGAIVADASRVVIGVGERVLLDFTGDGLIRFAVEGELERALVENYGSIEGRGVELTLRAARKAIQTVLNTDGIEVATGIEVSNGVIRLVGGSSIGAKTVVIEGEIVEAMGSIDASSRVAGSAGGRIEILGDRIELSGAALDASGDSGGGTILIGGDYQGKGAQRNARLTRMDGASVARADAYAQGDGGKVILWSDEATLFDGKVFARGGAKGGNGGFVETSGKESLRVMTGHVNTSAAQGNFGDWLLDPASIVVGTTGAGTLAQAASCTSGGTVSITAATIEAATSNVILCSQNGAGSTIAINTALTMPSGVSTSAGNTRRAIVTAIGGES